MSDTDSPDAPQYHQRPCGTLTADPPWRFSDKLPGDTRGAERHYPTLSVEEIRQFPLPPMLPDCYLLLWRVSSMVEEAYSVCRAWGFTPKSEIVWAKLTTGGMRHFGMGRHVRASHETCILAVRGKPKPLVRNVRSVFEAIVGPHSRKPDEFYKLAETLCPGPYAELFARRQRRGWMCYGNEVQHAEVA
jgi:site-specific DNA-methyltransferase (adenine-specific)